MKKIIYFIPAIIFTIFYGGLFLANEQIAIMPCVIMTTLFYVAGYFLCKDKFWGCLFGLPVGAVFIYMSTIDTGQILPIELPAGVIIIMFYLLCGGYVFYKNNKLKQNKI